MERGGREEQGCKREQELCVVFLKPFVYLCVHMCMLIHMCEHVHMEAGV